MFSAPYQSAGIFTTRTLSATNVVATDLDVNTNNPTPPAADEVGPQGPAGPPGAEGLKGPVGVTGAQGTNGTQGPMGPQGPAGPGGGPQGPQGPQGDAGAFGEFGPQGLPGPDGDTGPQGPQGFVGPQGVEGPQGPAGPQGDIGTYVPFTAQWFTDIPKDRAVYAFNGSMPKVDIAASGLEYLAIGITSEAKLTNEFGIVTLLGQYVTVSVPGMASGDIVYIQPDGTISTVNSPFPIGRAFTPSTLLVTKDV